MVDNDDKIVAHYDLQGRKIAKAAKGVRRMMGHSKKNM